MNLEDVLFLKQAIYAHRADGKEKETLRQHTLLCEKYYEKLIVEKKLEPIFYRFFGEYINEENPEYFKEMYDFCKEIQKGMINFHDSGKINPLFQTEKMKNKEFISFSLPFLKGARHSFFSALIYLDYCYGLLFQTSFSKLDKKKLKVLIIVNAYVIARHHGDLEDLKTFIGEFAPGGQAYESVIYLKEKTFFCYRGLCFLTEQNVETIINTWNSMSQRMEQKQAIYMNAYIRLSYSLLTSADYYATTEYMNGFEVTSFGEFSQKEDIANVYENSTIVRGIREYKDKFYGREDRSLDERNMNYLRNELFLDVELCWQEHESEDIFFLEAPTGSGKSNVAMNLSFQMLKKDLNRIFYVYPFNTLVEQNLESLKNIFGENTDIFSKITIVNSITPITKDIEKKDNMEEYDAVYYQKALLDRQFLNYPLVITTHVSFFETLFGNKRESVFGFLQIANSVVVLDEIQSYKNKIWSEIMLFLSNYAKMLNIKIIIMSATLPDLEYLTGEKNQVIRLLGQSNKYFFNPVFRDRVQVSYDMLGRKTNLDELYQHLCNHVNLGQKVLVEFIKKASAYEFYALLCKRRIKNMELRLLTGDDNTLDRKLILGEIKEIHKMGIVLVATQVVEAGADIDMDLGYKDISKLDSEEQFLGRINRSCKKRGIVYFFDLDEADKIYKGDIRINTEFTLKEDSMRKILSGKYFAAYYKPILEILKKNWNDSTGEEGLEAFFENTVRQGGFKGISTRMKLIDEDSWNMSVFLARTILLPDGSTLDGWKCWEEYKNLLQNQNIDYAEKQVKLYAVKSKMNYFIYDIRKNSNLIYSDCVGELYGIQNGEKYFTNGKLDRSKLEDAGGLFIDF